MKRKILVAYDGSSHSRKAIEEAKNEMKVMPETELHIVTVAEKSGPHTNKVLAEAFTEDVYKQAQKKLNEVENMCKEEGLSFVSKVIRHDKRENPGKSICRYATEEDIDRIIIGSRGLGNIKSVFLGSVSNEVVQHATCPVLVMK